MPRLFFADLSFSTEHRNRKYSSPTNVPSCHGWTSRSYSGDCRWDCWTLAIESERFRPLCLPSFVRFYLLLLSALSSTSTRKSVFVSWKKLMIVEMEMIWFSYEYYGLCVNSSLLSPSLSFWSKLTTCKVNSLITYHWRANAIRKRGSGPYDDRLGKVLRNPLSDFLRLHSYRF